MTRIMIPRSLLERGWPYRANKTDHEWVSVSGGRTIADMRFGLPSGKDRVILLDLATEAKARDAVVRRKPRAIAERFGLRWTDQQIVDAVHRVAFSVYEPAFSHMCCRRRCAVLTRRVVVAEDVHLCESTGDLIILLSESFIREATAGAPAKLSAVAELANAKQMATLDFYLALAWEEFHGRRIQVPVLEDGKLLGVLKAAENENKVFQQLVERWTRVAKADPDIRFRIAADGKFLIYEPRTCEASQSEAIEGTVNTPEPAVGSEDSIRRPTGGILDESERRTLRKARGVLTTLPWQRSKAVPDQEDEEQRLESWTLNQHKKAKG